MAGPVNRDGNDPTARPGDAPTAGGVQRLARAFDDRADAGCVTLIQAFRFADDSRARSSRRGRGASLRFR